jgi:hypothetical protein
MSGKKSSSGKESSVDVMPLVVAPQKPDRPHPYRFMRGGVSEAYRCTPEEAMEKVAAAQGSRGKR